MTCELIIIGTATALQLGQGVVIIGGLIVILLGGTNLYKAWIPKKEEEKEVKISPSPLPIQIADKFATKEELQQVKTEVKAEIKELEDALPRTERRILSAIEKNSDKLCAKVDKIATTAASSRSDLYEKNRTLGERVKGVETEIKNIKSKS